ncbi:TetR/AcrR family transcriptional regulator [Streptomyces sp. WMMC1477]|uniref:TetR/AcrR family transcriptional regulator n=1 Tax=Streptomyces sp. WMMC1477 TaxID=3015155 RepID=UPI0022B6B803|nr:TetR/AcrR family transcriptional regulator [Streptomyces sp. WMMC1477]MCZ7434723.1 TetR/AcrR family transcriptional regulator [Streptomyces sp. WMMC1477]
MDTLRTASGLSLKRLYRCFPAKADLVEAYLRRRAARWRAALSSYIDEHGATPHDRVLAVFDWLARWFSGDGFRGCAFINAFGEAGAVSDGVVHAVRDHKQAVGAYLTGLTRDLGRGDASALAQQLLLLLDGAITTAAISGDPAAAGHARRAAEALLAAAPRVEAGG